METINWANYNFIDFTAFCNALLTFEVSKKVKPFSAPGPDGGIDASYSGAYGSDTGTWRFQFKFHKTARKQAFHQLKSELVGEIKDLKQENYFVLMTNVELLPQEYKELEEVFQKEKGAYGPSTEFKIWDGAKLQTFSLRHPLIRLWMEDGFEAAQLQDYKNYFERGLNATGFEPYTLSNIFIARKSDLDDLESFILSDRVLAVVSGEAGIGKTRMVIEFFKQKIENLDGWNALVLANRNIDFDRLRGALSSEAYFVILVDDAHSYHADDIADLKKLAELSKGKVKLILTTRSLEASSALSKIKEYDQDRILTIKLSTLRRDDTKEAFRTYIENTAYWHYIDDLIKTSYGRPVLIVAILKAIVDRTRIEEIKDTDFLKNYVNNYFATFYDELNRTTGISTLRAKRLLQNISLIEPFNFNNSSIAEIISGLHDIKMPELRLAFELLVQHSFVSGRYEQSIKPDFYSDILLQEIDIDDASDYVSAFNELLDNIVINLSSIDKEESGKGDLLDAILNKYVGWIASDDESAELSVEKKIPLINRIMSTVSQIVYVRPAIAHKAVEIYIENLEVQNHPVNMEFVQSTMFQYFPADTLLNKVTVILSRLLSLPSSYSFVFSASFKLFEITQDKKIFTIYNFSKRDVTGKYELPRQKYFLNRIKQRENLLNNVSYKFVLEVFTANLALDFTLSELSAVDRDSFNITTYYIPETEIVQEFRIQLIRQLVSFYNLPNLSASKLETLKLLVDIPRGIFATQRSNLVYKGISEISEVLTFLENQAEGFDILEQREILDKLFWYIKWKIDDAFIPQIERIKAKMKPKNLTEKLSQIFTKAEISLLEYGDVRAFMEAKCDEYVAAYSAEELSESLRKFLEPQAYTPHYFWEFLSVLQRKHISYAIYFHDYLLKISSPLYYQYASGVLYTLRFEVDDQSLFWNRVNILESLDTWEADNVILLAYSNRVPGTANVELKDAETIVKVYRKKRNENNHALASGLQTVIVANYPDTEQIIGDYLDRAHQREAEMFFIWLTDNKSASKELVKHLVLNHTLRFYLSYEFERGLTRVLQDYGLDVVFEYLISRFDYKKELVESTLSLIGYDFLPPGDQSQMLNDQPEIKFELFEKALIWFITVNGTGGHLFYGKDLLVYLRPGKSVTKELENLYTMTINANIASLEKLERIAETLTIFESKESLLITLVIKIYTAAIELKDSDEEMFKYTRYALVSAVTSMGVKQGKVGEPFQVDVDLRNLLHNEIAKLPQYLDARQFLSDVLASVNNDINRNLDRDNETWQ